MAYTSKFRGGVQHKSHDKHTTHDKNKRISKTHARHTTHAKNKRISDHVLNILEYFSAESARMSLNACYKGVTQISHLEGSQHHFVVNFDPLRKTRAGGHQNCNIKNPFHIEDSYTMKCQSIPSEERLPGFTDTFCFLYSMYNQARHKYNDENSAGVVELNDERCLARLFTVADEPALYEAYKHKLAKVKLDEIQKKQLSRLLSNRDLMVRLFKRMAADNNFWDCLSEVWSREIWEAWGVFNLQGKRKNLIYAANQFQSYTFNQKNVPNIVFINLLKGRACDFGVQRKYNSQGFLIEPVT